VFELLLQDKPSELIDAFILLSCLRRQRRDAEKALMKVKEQAINDHSQNHAPPADLTDL
jgi:hypothetical protein